MPEDQIVARTKEVFALAEQLFKVNLSDVKVRFDLFGADAGRAGATGDVGDGYQLYYIRFNRDMLHRKAFDHVYAEAVPHETAHIICYKCPELGQGHCRGWQSICRALGGTGTVLHNEAIVYGRGKTYEYQTSKGFAVRVSQQVHNRVQKGFVYAFDMGRGIVDISSTYTVVGEKGRSI